PLSEYVRLQNPISSEREVMRHSLLAGVLDVAATNLQHTNDVRLFEIGSVYLPRPNKKLPDEPRRPALVLCGEWQQELWGVTAGTPQPLDFYDVKGILEALAVDLHLANVAYRPVKVPALHPGRAAEVVAGERVLGHFGELHPKVAEAFNLGGRAVLAGEIDLE